METFVFLFTGFIDSGKTTLMRDTIESPDFKSSSNLIIMCEEGDESLDDEFLKRNNSSLEIVRAKDQLDTSYFNDLKKKYNPEQVFIEYNGTWEMNTLLSLKLPKNWEWGGIYSTVDCETVDMYLANMRQMFMEQFGQSGLIIFNRCKEDVDRGRLRRIFKALNPPVQMIFERPDGNMYDPSEDPLPFDITKDSIEIDPLDFGIWYIDALELPEHYYKKELKFLAQLYCGSDLPSHTFVPGRFIMTCCEADIKFMGFLCEYDGELPFKQRDFVNITVIFDYKFVPQYGEKVPVLKLVDIEKAERPEVDPVFFS